MKKNYFLLFLLCLFICNSSRAQADDSYIEKELEELLDSLINEVDNYHYEQAIDITHSLLTKAKDLKNHYYISKGYNFLGHIYTDKKDSARARKNYTLGLEYAYLSKNDTLLMHAYNNLGNVYSEIPQTTYKGISFYNEAIKEAKKVGSPLDVITPRTNIGWTYLDLGQHKKAYPYIHNSLELLDSTEVTDSLDKEYKEYLYSQIYMLHGRYFSQEKEYDTARYYFETSLRMVEKDSAILLAADTYREYSKMLAQKGDYKKAYEAQQKYIDYNEQVFEKEKLKQTEIANARFNLNQYKKDLLIAEKEQKYQNDIIQKSKEKVVVMVFSSIGMIFILVFLYKVNRDRQNLIEKLKHKNVQYRDAKVEAEKLSLLKTRFFSTVSHEIRTPLYGVIGLTSLLLEDKSLDKHKSDLKSLKFSADYLLALINDVLQMNKMESNEVKLENVSFNLRDLMNSIVNSFEFTRVQNRNKIHLDIDESIPAYLIGDSVRLSQVLMNLVGNATKFTERGNIHIIARQIDSEAETSKIYFEIKDDGPGIPESKKKVIFEEFSQLSNSNYNYQGTGLGLPIVKRLLKLFRSKINLESEEGKGSTFSFSILFKVDTSKKEIEKPEEEFKSLHNEDRKRILIVDDNRINQVVTKRILEKKDFECEVAGDGQTAIDLVQNGNYDLVLMDVNMPGISGLEATKEIRKFDQHIPVLALTAVEVEEIREEIQAAGMSGIIIKPYDVQQFYQIVYKNLSLNEYTEEL
ncbi:tetratricopeptide repeat-containing hybrid sensor histidine kinase/response regulator [Christiangramia aestuarii]|uniref:histidine kinase n=1 Tax=Christiangramia aestuarii TaxID=1028746 RepID=A0A7M3SXN1_9FLAO|nr:response regulator [Christiangramia aestuarii]MUP41362.1 response regulator [Christiangramia aestuarii]